MPEGSGPRFAVEASFLILLAVGVAIADLDPWLIVLVMAVGWLLQVLVELMAWRARPRAVVAAGPVAAGMVELPTASAPEYPLAPEYAPPPAPGTDVAFTELSPAPAGDYDFEFAQPAAAPADGATEVLGDRAADEVAAAQPTRVGDASSAEAAVARPAEALAFHAPSRRERIRLEPLQPRPRRRWLGRGPAQGDGGREAEG